MKPFNSAAEVHDLYRRKQECKRSGDTIKEFMYKKLLNSFYGKWGVNGITTLWSRPNGRVI